jgi:nucleotide-binding universal stress UspA family protein
MTESSHRYVLLAALQFDETGIRALGEACRIAQRDSIAELHVVHAIAASLLPEHDGEPTSIAAQLERAPIKLREYVDRACAGTTIKVVAHVRAGTPAQIILQTAADLDADMIVLGTHQRRGVEKLLLGSVAERVLREAPCPVLIAAPKSFHAAPASSSIEPPCPDCVEARNSPQDVAWCERHSHGRLRPHVYMPSDRPSTSVLGT